MKTFEYVRLQVDWGDLSELNSLGSGGWHVVASAPAQYGIWALLERDLPEKQSPRLMEYGSKSWMG